MSRLFLLSGAVRRAPAIETWFADQADDLRPIARRWFERMRDCGDDVRELMHDGCPVACVQDAAFGYVNAFKAHVNVGFYCGAMLDDPARLLEGAGKRMRHVKLRPGQELDVEALTDLIAAAYRDIRSRLGLP
jgi:hypothetical protein